MNRITVVFLGCVVSIGAIVIAFSCAEGGQPPCVPGECTAGCRAGGFADGVCGGAGCECTGTDAGFDADADVVDVAREDAAEAAEVRPADAEVYSDDHERDEDSGRWAICNPEGSCESAACAQCCIDNYGMSAGSCSASSCGCSPGTHVDEVTPDTPEASTD